MRLGAFPQSTAIGIGGDPVVGSGFIDVLSKFEADDETVDRIFRRAKASPTVLTEDEIRTELAQTKGGEEVQAQLKQRTEDAEKATLAVRQVLGYFGRRIERVPLNSHGLALVTGKAPDGRTTDFS